MRGEDNENGSAYDSDDFQTQNENESISEDEIIEEEVKSDKGGVESPTKKMMGSKGFHLSQ